MAKSQSQWVNPIFPVHNKANPSSRFTPSRPSKKAVLFTFDLFCCNRCQCCHWVKSIERFIWIFREWASDHWVQTLRRHWWRNKRHFLRLYVSGTQLTCLEAPYSWRFLRIWKLILENWKIAQFAGTKQQWSPSNIITSALCLTLCPWRAFQLLEHFE